MIRTDLLYEAEGYGEFAPKKRKLEAVAGGGDDENGGISKAMKVMNEGGREGKTKVVMMPNSVGQEKGGKGEEGIGG